MKGWYETMLWVISVIDSCTHPIQDIACGKLVRNYLTMYEKQLGGKSGNLYISTEKRFRIAIDENRYQRVIKITKNN
jgi:hypothetical protein